MTLRAEFLGSQRRQPAPLAMNVPARNAEKRRFVVQIANVALLTFWTGNGFKRSQRLFSGRSFLGQIGHESVDNFRRGVDEGVGGGRRRSSVACRRNFSASASDELLLWRGGLGPGGWRHAAVRRRIDQIAAVVAAAAGIVVVGVGVAAVEVLLLIVGDGFDEKSAHIALNLLGE